ncbi:MAG: hypothetical protein AAGI07_18110 [Bacteroidota bacterium]
MILRFYSIIFTAFLFLTCFPAFSQTYPLGLTPSKLRWQQINNADMQIVFPEEVGQQAQRIANLITYLKSNNLESIGNKTDKVTIILQNQTITPNGFVALSPFRSELFLTPPQFNFLGAGDWLDLLTIHEYRHVLQTTNAKKGITGFGSFLLGENTLAFLRRLALPRWYLEGDAVGTETALTTSGRGRLPHFEMEYRAMRLSGRKYNYEKASAFSLKDFVPDHYKVGYYMTTWARRNFGEDIWQTSLNEAVRYKKLFYPLSSSLKKNTGYSTPQMYNAAMLALDSSWQAQDQALVTTPALKLSKGDGNRYTNYRNPQYIDEDTWIVEKSSFNQIRTYYTVDRSGNERKLFAPGFNYSFNNTLSVANNQIAWAETTFDPRWGAKDFSIIKTGDLEGSKRLKLSARSKYFAPSLSTDGSKIIVVKITEKQEYTLVLLDTKTGSVIKELPNSENYFFSFPRVTEDSEHVVVVAQKDQQHALIKVNIANGTVDFLTDFSTEQLSNPFPKGNKVYYSATYTGINNIFAVDTESKQISQITSSRFGAFQPAVSPSGSKLVYSDYTALGYELKEVELNTPLLTVSNNNLPTSMIDFHQPIVKQEEGAIFNRVGTETFPTKKFSKLSGFINPHSLQAFPFHPNYSAEIQFENKFQTMNGALGYNYNVNENTGGFFANIAYAQFFPVIEGGIRFDNTRSRTAFLANSIVRNDTL